MHIWSLFRFTAATGVAVGTASAAQSRTMDGDPCECKPTSVGAAESHLCSLSHPHPFPWVSIVPVGLCSEPDWAPDPAVTALGEKAVTTQLDQHLELLPSVITQLLLQGRGETVSREDRRKELTQHPACILAHGPMEPSPFWIGPVRWQNVGRAEVCASQSSRAYQILKWIKLWLRDVV